MKRGCLYEGGGKFKGRPPPTTKNTQRIYNNANLKYMMEKQLEAAPPITKTPKVRKQPKVNKQPKAAPPITKTPKVNKQPKAGRR